MRFEASIENNVLVVAIEMVTLDATNSGEFKQDIGPIIENQSRVLFDLSNLNFIDSSGLGAMLSSLRRISAAGGQLKLCGLQPRVQSVFTLVRMNQVFDISATRTDAMHSFSI